MSKLKISYCINYNNNTITSGHDGVNMIVDVPSPIMERVVDVLNDSGEEEEEEC